VRRHGRILAAQLRATLAGLVQYRFDFVTEGLLEIIWAAAALVPLFVVFGARETVAGWTFGEALLVVGWFTLLQAILDGAINPGLVSVVDHIRKGTLDFVLLKPVDAQFLVSTSRLEPWRATNVVTAAVIFGYAFHLIGRPPAPLAVAAALVLLLGATLILYSLWILSVSIAFYVVKIDNLTHLFNSVFDAARWPSSVFRGLLGVVFTFVIPLALMTTYPALALLGRLEPAPLAGALAVAAVFAVVSRRVWLRALSRYTSASS
jgi:ABC-2 type transport system permease protein